MDTKKTEKGVKPRLIERGMSRVVTGVRGQGYPPYSHDRLLSMAGGMELKHNQTEANPPKKQKHKCTSNLLRKGSQSNIER